jgi:ParB family chromosome partitioning protein
MKYDYEISDSVYKIPVVEIYASSEFNCRDEFTQLSVRGLSETIREIGKLIEPIIVQPMEDVDPHERPTGNFKWRMIAGHRRLAAVKLLGWVVVQSRIVEGLSALDAARLNLLENIEREDLNIFEEAKALAKVWSGFSDKDVAKQLKRPKKWVYVRRLLLTLPEEVQKAAGSGRISQYDIEFIGRVEPYRQKTVFEQILAKKAGKNVSSPRVNGKAYNKTKKRSAQEIKQMMVHLMELSRVLNWDCSEVASTLAWVLGNISTRELLAERLPLHYDESLFDD